MKLSENSIKSVEVSAYSIRTDAPEGDGTFKWNSTTHVFCESRAGDKDRNRIHLRQQSCSRGG